MVHMLERRRDRRKEGVGGEKQGGGKQVNTQKYTKICIKQYMPLLKARPCTLYALNISYSSSEKCKLFFPFYKPKHLTVFFLSTSEVSNNFFSLLFLEYGKIVLKRKRQMFTAYGWSVDVNAMNEAADHPADRGLRRKTLKKMQSRT